MDERIEAITNAAAMAERKYPSAFYPVRNRWERWGYTASMALLNQLEELGWTISKKDDSE